MSQTLDMPNKVVKVSHPDDLTDEQFLLHMDKRHAREGFAHHAPHITPEQVELWRKYHDRLHEIAVPNQYDHTHVGM